MSHFSAIKQVIENRKSIFPTQLNDKKNISDEDVNAILESANFAPSHYRTEPWRFIVFSGNALNDFFDTQINLYKQLTPEAEFSEVKIKKMHMKARMLSHLIVIVVHYNKENKLPRKEEEWAVACAVQNMHLTCASLNVGAYWGTGKLAYAKEMHTYLELAENEAVMGFFQMGVPNENLKLLDKRPITPIQEKVIWKK
jgi:nitroreductase